MYIHPTDLIHITERRTHDLIEAADHRRLARFARRANRRSSG
jgi:hypothetical protein